MATPSAARLTTTRVRVAPWHGTRWRRSLPGHAAIAPPRYVEVPDATHLLAAEHPEHLATLLADLALPRVSHGSQMCDTTRSEASRARQHQEGP